KPQKVVYEAPLTSQEGDHHAGVTRYSMHLPRWATSNLGRVLKPVHTFVDATEQQLKGICGKKNNKVNCMSRDSFKVYDIQCKKNGHYTNEGNIIRQTQIVVTCEDNFPVHFVKAGVCIWRHRDKTVVELQKT
uniref:Ribonuclease A-domain domain-containing protein n=1 Tax=Erpetoichthys calabaricus TaxID=27687 RepID=A0A8C4RJF3_ERPCA